jgi:hypothetical protein
VTLTKSSSPTPRCTGRATDGGALAFRP